MTSFSHTRKIGCVLFIAALILGCISSGCSSKPKKEARRYDITGKVVSVDKAKKQVVLAHHDIPGFMKAMTMDFKVKDEWTLDVMEPGDKLSGQLVVDPDGAYIEGISIAKHAGTEPERSSSPVHEPKVGDEPPDFTLINQDGEKDQPATISRKASVADLYLHALPATRLLHPHEQ